MAYAKAKLVIIKADMHNINATLETFVELHCFHPVKADEFIDLVHGLTAIQDNLSCREALNKIKDIEKENAFKIPVAYVKTVSDTLIHMQGRLTYIQTKLKSFAKHNKEAEELIKKYEDALIQMKNLESLEVSLDDIFACDYVYARVGRLPTESVKKLNFYQAKPFIFNSFSVDKNYSWCIYFTSQEYEREVDNIFSSLFFERIYIPDFIHGTPKDANDRLTSEIEAAKIEVKSIQESRNAYMKNTYEELITIKSWVLLLVRINEAKKYVVGMGDKFSITGYVKEKDVITVQKQFLDMDNVELSILPADYDRRLKPPARLKDQSAF